MATRKSAAKATSPSPRKAPAKTTAKQAEGKSPVRSTARPAVTPRRAAASADRAAPPLPTPASSPAPVDASPAIGRVAAEPLSGEARYRWIAHAAYLRAERRGFAPGHEIDDWLAAEADFEAAMNSGAG